jgi:hypothetical protein
LTNRCASGSQRSTHSHDCHRQVASEIGRYDNGEAQVHEILAILDETDAPIGAAGVSQSAARRTAGSRRGARRLRIVAHHLRARLTTCSRAAKRPGCPTYPATSTVVDTLGRPGRTRLCRDSMVAVWYITALAECCDES